jgi:putative phosphotransacetylase
VTKELIEQVVQEVVKQVQTPSTYSFIVPIGISNRHVHLSEEDLHKLYGKGHRLTPIKELSQPGEFACEEKVDLIYGDRMIKGVRVLGPTRKQTQVEIAQTDARQLRVKLKVRNSGELEGTHPITLRTSKGEVQLQEGLIIATRHLHLTTEDAKRFNVSHNDQVSVRLGGPKSGVIDQVSCKVSDSYSLELHLDTDDGNAFLLNSGDMAELIR